jgi:hypothetical protein
MTSTMFAFWYDKVARPEGALSNELFRVLGDWNAYLKQENIDPTRLGL